MEVDNQDDPMFENDNEGSIFDQTSASCQVQIMTDLDMKKIVEIEKRLANLTFERESFFQDDRRTKYYTGLPSYKILYWLEGLVAPYLYRQSSKCSTFQQLVLALMKLRINSDLEDLSDR